MPIGKWRTIYWVRCHLFNRQHAPLRALCMKGCSEGQRGLEGFMQTEMTRRCRVLAKGIPRTLKTLWFSTNRMGCLYWFQVFVCVLHFRHAQCILAHNFVSLSRWLDKCCGCCLCLSKDGFCKCYFGGWGYHFPSNYVKSAYWRGSDNEQNTYVGHHKQVPERNAAISHFKKFHTPSTI